MSKDNKPFKLPIPLDLLKAYGKAMKQVPGSSRQNETKKQIEKLRSNVKEDIGAAPTNSAGTGAVAGIGVGKDGEPGIKKFAGSRVFKVPTKNFVMARMLKRKYQRFEEYVGDANLSKEIAEYANKNYGAGIVLEDESTGAMMYLRYGNGK